MQQLVVLFVALCISWSSWVKAQDDAGYLLGPGDKIIIQVYGEEELKIETQLTDAAK